MGRQKRFKRITLDIQDSMPPTHRRASSIPPAHNGATSVPPTHNGASYAQSTHTGAIYAQSTHIGATSVQSTHTGSTSVQSNHNGANSEHEDTNFLDESEDNITLTSGQTSTVRHKSDGYWRVSLIDDNGTITQENLKVQDIWTLPIGKKVIVPASELGQPTDDGGGLLSGFMGNLACDFSKLPMCYATWLKVPQKYKDSLYNDIIKKKFHIVDTRMEKFIMQKIGRRWGGARNRLYHSFYDESLSLEENLPNRPGGVDLDQWIWFAQHQNDSKTLEMRKKNTENRKLQKYTYTGGSKSISRRKAEEERKRGRPMSRGEMWTIVHKRQNGSYVNDAARVIGEEIENIERQNGSSFTVSQDDSVARVLGKEHPGRIRAVGFGPCPTQVFGQTTHPCSQTFTQPTQDKKIDEIKSELQAEKSKVQELESTVAAERLNRQNLESIVGYISKCFIQQGGDMPPELAAIVTAMVSNEECREISPGVRPSSSASHNNRC